jgi:hypothetical protein
MAAYVCTTDALANTLAGEVAIYRQNRGYVKVLEYYSSKGMLSGGSAIRMWAEY